MDGKNDVSSESIRNLIMEGWRLRKNPKKVRNSTYITLRKGNREKGLGKYSEERFRRFNRIQDEVLGKQRENDTHYQNFGQVFVSADKSLDKFMMHIQYQRGHYKRTNCVYVKEYFCSYWKWEQKPPIEWLIPPFHMDSKKVLIPELGEERWVLQATVQYCTLCTAFQKKD
jgi:hypothetical protein